MKIQSLPSKKYQIIYADPPWSYKDKALSGNRGAGCKYDIMESVDIANMDIAPLADKNCTLFMWVTYPKLNECFEVIAKWGFEYKTVAFIWIKLNKKTSSLFWGMGRWTRSNAEGLFIVNKRRTKKNICRCTFGNYVSNRETFSKAGYSTQTDP